MSMTVPDLKGFTIYYGVPVSDIGEDGNLIALGHHDTRQVLAAFNRHARTFWGLTDLYDGRLPMFPRHHAVEDVCERWAVLVKECDEARQPDHTGDCSRCRLLKEEDWWIDYSAKEPTLGSFPVMVWAH